MPDLERGKNLVKSTQSYRDSITSKSATSLSAVPATAHVQCVHSNATVCIHVVRTAGRCGRTVCNSGTFTKRKKHKRTINHQIFKFKGKRKHHLSRSLSLCVCLFPHQYVRYIYIPDCGAIKCFFFFFFFAHSILSCRRELIFPSKLAEKFFFFFFSQELGSSAAPNDRNASVSIDLSTSLALVSFFFF